MKNNLSYESSKWYIKLWRHRWYLYAIYVYFRHISKIDTILNYFMNEGSLEDSVKKELKTTWNDVKTSVELSKMYKFSTKYRYEREE